MAIAHMPEQIQPIGKLAISNRQAAIQGMPAISDVDGRYNGKALMAMRGVNQKVHKSLREDGRSKLHPRPIAYKGASKCGKV